MQQSLGKPDPFRLRNRKLIAGIISEIVLGSMNKKTAIAVIKQRTMENLPNEDRNQFIEVVETELMSLHEGNIARYRLRPSEYQMWKKTWQ